jgi:hypothetical protein
MRLKKAKKDCLFIIYCDYGIPNQKMIVRRSYSEESAKNSWKKFNKNFSQGNWRCWQENKQGKIVNESKK